MKEEVGLNFKKTYRKPNKILRLIKAIKHALGVEVSHILVKLFQRLVKNSTPVKRWDTSQKNVNANSTIFR